MAVLFQKKAIYFYRLMLRIDDALHALLNHEDDRVKVNAASFCLNSEVLVEQSILTLEKIIAGSDDPTICFSAKMLLQKFR